MLIIKKRLKFLPESDISDFHVDLRSDNDNYIGFSLKYVDPKSSIDFFIEKSFFPENFQFCVC